MTPASLSVLVRWPKSSGHPTVHGGTAMLLHPDLPLLGQV